VIEDFIGVMIGWCAILAIGGGYIAWRDRMKRRFNRTDNRRQLVESMARYRCSRG
jgi:hypothetical protein